MRKNTLKTERLERKEKTMSSYVGRVYKEDNATNEVDEGSYNGGNVVATVDGCL
jgi:hypothetical protein